MTLIAGPKQRGCIFCRLPRAPQARENLVLATDRDTVVMLNRFPYNSGHVMVAPRRHVADLGRLRRAEHAALAETLRRAVDVVGREFHPQGINIGMNLGAAAGAGIADHLHWHVVPRWNGDTNFMPAIGSVKVIAEHLLATYDRLRPRFTASLRAVRSRKRP